MLNLIIKTSFSETSVLLFHLDVLSEKLGHNQEYILLLMLKIKKNPSREMF